VATIPIPKKFLLLRHRSLSLTQILKEMNIYSNNAMAEMLAQSVGGAQVTAQLATKSAGVPPEEIQLANGSGLGVENRISPRATCAMLMAVERFLQHPTNFSVADIFPVVWARQAGNHACAAHPSGTAIKTGTLRDVSALAGVMPTRDRGEVWFAIINRGGDVDGFRTQQDLTARTLVKQWGTLPTC
jgi:D-alanyl-D-alanine carboxypeptidase/D-alanyl-D-alanine-endopeptidase (penicillin-binding protein 4)